MGATGIEEEEKEEEGRGGGEEESSRGLKLNGGVIPPLPQTSSWRGA
jgi:hypothetical protein